MANKTIPRSYNCPLDFNDQSLAPPGSERIAWDDKHEIIFNTYDSECGGITARLSVCVRNIGENSWCGNILSDAAANAMAEWDEEAERTDVGGEYRRYAWDKARQWRELFRWLRAQEPKEKGEPT
ncbi:MAG: hypothetical protein WC505_08035 [Patescibacteria group bacterium]